MPLINQPPLKENTMSAPYRKAIAAFLTPLSVWLLAVLASGGDWTVGLELVAAAVVTLVTVFLVPNTPATDLDRPR